MICKNCKKQFMQRKQGHELCYTCWTKTVRTCKNCNKPIYNLPKYYTYCKQCYNEKEKIKSCKTCEFNFYNNGICAGHGTIKNSQTDTYGMEISETMKLFPNGCDNWNNH